MPKIAELTEEISQADQTFDQSIGELRDKQVFFFFLSSSSAALWNSISILCQDVKRR